MAIFSQILDIHEYDLDLDLGSGYTAYHGRVGHGLDSSMDWIWLDWI